MARQIGTKLLLLVPVILLVSVATFSMTELLPGDPAVAILGENARPDLVAQVREEYGFDRPVWERYLEWAKDAVQGDLGRSLWSHQPVTEAFAERLPVTLQLAVMAQVIALALAIPTAAVAAWRDGGRFDRGLSAVSFSLISLPAFVLGIVLVAMFALHWQLFPVTGWERLSDGVGANLRHAFLPALTLALGEFAVYAQLLRADMGAVLREEYIAAARSRGLSSRHIVMHEALRPSSFALITLTGLNLGRLIGGTVIIENLFGLGGVGTLVARAVTSSDFPVIQGSVLLFAVGYLLINTVVDVGYGFLDPRVRRSVR